LAASDPLVAALDAATADLSPGEPPGDALGVAVSGGGDSVALLLAAIERGPVRAVTVDHGLRAGSADEARWVADLCARHDVPHDVLTLALTPGAGLQARARAARYAALSGWARGRVAAVMLGHNRDDVGETLAMRLRRGVGVSGLAAMPEGWRDARGVRFLRPFLGLSRAGLRDWLRARGQDWIDDPSNDDAGFERVEIRQAMAALGWEAGALARSANALRQASDALDAQVAALAATVLGRDAAGDVLFDPLAVGEPEIARRIWAVALDHVGGARAPRAAELRGAMEAPDGDRRTLAGCVVTRSGIVRVAREPAACPGPVAATEPWDRRWRIVGPRVGGAQIGALGEDVTRTPWRETGLPRGSLMATPALRRDGGLVAAPVAGLGGGYAACLAGGPTAAIDGRDRVIR